MPRIGIGKGLGTRNSGEDWSSYWTTQRILDSFGSKILAWWKTSDATAGYYKDQIGTQERESLIQNSIAGKVWKGRAINFDGDLSQNSTIGVAPTSFQLNTNPITISFCVKASVIPATARLLIGLTPATTNGVYYIGIDTAGRIVNVLRDGSTRSLISISKITDGLWHHVVVVMYPNNYAKIYVDKILNNTLDLTGVTYNAITTPFNIGGVPSYFTGEDVFMRDIRLFSSAITSQTDINTLYNQEYLTGVISWWTCEDTATLDGTNVNLVTRDCVGANHAYNNNFSAASYVTGFWASLLNKFGYAEKITNSDYLLGDGMFSDASLWTIAATRFVVADGVASYLAADDLNNNLITKRVWAIAAGTIIKFSFTVTEGLLPRFRFANQAGQILTAHATYAVGSHDVVIKMPYAATGLRIVAEAAANGAFKMDNLTISLHSETPVMPKIDKAVPDTDIFGNALVFTGNAKLNLIISGANVKMPDVGEIYETTELISVNDWFNAGVAQEIAWNNVEYYAQYQYKSDTDIVLIKANSPLTIAEDKALKYHLRVSQTLSITDDVWILAGQSNAMANALVADQTIAGYDAELVNAFIWNRENSALELIDPGVNTTYDSPAGYYVGYFGPETAFLKDFKTLTGRRQNVVKLAKGSTHLELQAAEDDWSELSAGELLDTLKGYINDADAYMTANGKTMVIRGIIWVQGEDDVSQATLYYTNLVNFFNNLRLFCNAINITNLGESIPLINIVSRLSINQNYTAAQLAVMRLAQANFITDKGGVLVDTDAYALAVDNIHFTADSIIKMGQDGAVGAKAIM